MKNMEIPENFEPSAYLDAMYEGYEKMVGQYFTEDYCPTLSQIEAMYVQTDLDSIDMPLSVHEMLKLEEE